MNISAWVKNNRFLTLALVFTVLNAVAIFAIFGFKKYGDTIDYINLIHWFSGEGNSFEVARILRPLGPFLALPFEFLGDGAGLVAQNIFFYFLAAWLVFNITDLIFQNKKQAFFAVLFFITASPVIESGLAYLTDMGAWFFYLLSVFLTLLYLKNKDEKLVVLNGFLSGVGVLMKENGGLGVIFFGLMILFSREFNFKQKFWKIMKFGGAFLMPIIALQFFVYHTFHYTSLDWYLRNASGSPGEGILLVSLRYLGQFFRILGLVWLPLLFGIWQELKKKNRPRIKIYLALIPASFSFLLWSVSASARSVFIFAPLGILLASYGFVSLLDLLGKKGKIMLVALFFMAVLFLNYSFCLVNQEIAFTYAIYNFIQRCIK
ncbi:MAG: glycosyltransferase family 39 protein [Candidatus Nealsonbacteria bacterium]